MHSVKRENGGKAKTFSDDHDVCTSSDDRNDLPLPPIHSFTMSAMTHEVEERPTSSTRDVVCLIGKRRPIKIHIGWMHKVGDKYRQVRRKYGGGTRELILDNLNIYPAEIVQRAITLFFPEGVSQVISVDEVESFALGNFCGEELSKFSDDRGDECSLGQYLKAQGTYASRCYIYLLTKKKSSETSPEVFGSESLPRRKRVTRGRYAEHRPPSSFRYAYDTPMYVPDSTFSQCDGNAFYYSRASQDRLHSSTSRLLPTDKLGFIVDGRPAIEVRYSFEANSPFANIVDPGTEFTRRESLEFSLFRSPLLDIVDFEPTNHGFVVKSVKINGTEFVKTEDSRQLSFGLPEAGDSAGLILHSPTEVWGYDGDELILGVIASCHGVCKPFYSWYRNELVHQEGVNLCCVTATVPGVYFCKVTFQDSYDISQPLQIVEFADCSFKSPKVESSCEDINFSCCFFTPESPSRIIPSVGRENLDVDFTSRICNGTFGTVYKANWLGTDVHVELLKLDVLGPEKDDFVHSLRVVNSRIRHPNILSLMACVEQRGHVSLVSEYHEGATLESLIFSTETRQYLTLDSVQKQGIAVQTCQALVYLHALSPPIIHRAVHPASVWILNQGSVAKLCCPHVRTSVTSSNMTVYSAPECLTSSQDGDLCSDVWGVGATVTVMLTEENLWGDLSQEGLPLNVVLNQLEHGQSPPALQSLDMWKDILTACLNIDPSLRPSAMQLLSHLRI